MKRMKLLIAVVLGASVASCAVWHERTVDRAAAAPVPAERASTSTTASTAFFAADYPRDQRRPGVAEGGAGGAGGSMMR